MDVDRILPKLLVGSCPVDRHNVESLKTRRGVTAVLNLQTDDDFAAWGIDWPKLEAAYRARGSWSAASPLPTSTPRPCGKNSRRVSTPSTNC